jgi:hypothetical protein
MSRFIPWLVRGVRTTAAEFFGQALGLLILLCAVAAWAYFESLYAVIAVAIAGSLILAGVYRAAEGKKPKGESAKGRRSR